MVARSFGEPRLPPRTILKFVSFASAVEPEHEAVERVAEGPAQLGLRAVDGGIAIGTILGRPLAREVDAHAQVAAPLGEGMRPVGGEFADVAAAAARLPCREQILSP